MFARWFIPYKLKWLRRLWGDRPFTLLDIGAGNHSPSITKRWFPDCVYHGLDVTRNYELDDSDFSVMKEFYELNLETLQFESIPDGHFDMIVMAHVIEHLRSGDKVVEALLPKLKPGGMFYVEFPAERSTRLPSMPMSLNFYDDPTHVRIYSVAELSEVFRRAGCTIVGGGTRRDWVRIIFLPLLAVRILMRYGHLTGGLFWDLCGFADYVIARKGA